MNYLRLNDLQRKLVPLLISGESAIINTPPGSGKTLCYAKTAAERKRTIILTPTKELAMQTYMTCRKVEPTLRVSRIEASNGHRLAVIQRSLGKLLDWNAIDVCITTPTQLEQMLRKGATMTQANCLIVDEGDLMLLDSTMRESITQIMSRINCEQLIVGSSVSGVAGSALHRKLPTYTARDFMKAREVEFQEKELMNYIDGRTTMIFVNSLEDCIELQKQIPSIIYHGDLSSEDRIYNLQQFLSGSANVLISTLLGCRGLDLPNVEQVIIRDLPTQYSTLLLQMGRLRNTSGRIVLCLKNSLESRSLHHYIDLTGLIQSPQIIIIPEPTSIKETTRTVQPKKLETSLLDNIHKYKQQSYNLNQFRQLKKCRIRHASEPVQHNTPPRSIKKVQPIQPNYYGFFDKSRVYGDSTRSETLNKNHQLLKTMFRAEQKHNREQTFQINDQIFMQLQNEFNNTTELRTKERQLKIQQHEEKLNKTELAIPKSSYKCAQQSMSRDSDSDVDINSQPQKPFIREPRNRIPKVIIQQQFAEHRWRKVRQLVTPMQKSTITGNPHNLVESTRYIERLHAGDKLELETQFQILMDSLYNYENYTQKAYSANVYKVDESEFIIDKRYKPTQQLGSGAYGVVIGCEDQKATKPEFKNVAIKKIERTFEHRFYAKRTLREMKILRNLKHENIVNLLTCQLPKSRKNFYDIYIVTELLDTDLKRVIEKEHAKLNQDHYKLFVYQILRAMKYMHSANILHRDLKPTNLLLNKKDCMLKVCDFGLSRALLQTTKNQPQNPNIMTDYVETRYYRAPELLLGLKTYSQPVDIWSVGCIFAEIVRGKTLWKGQNSKQQLKLIFETLGTPSKAKVLQMTDSFVSQKMLEAIQEIGTLEKIPWDKVVKGLPPEGYDLLEKLLELDYKKRITAAEALKHPFLKDLHNPDDEPTRPPVSNMEFEFETFEFTNEQLKDMIYEELLLYHSPEFKKAYDDKIKNGQSVINHILKGESAKIIDPEADDDFPI